MYLLLDNHDSFTYNLAQLVRQSGVQVEVIRAGNDYDLSRYSAVILSPGPGTPSDAGDCRRIARLALDSNLEIPILGVCLGMQVLAIEAGAIVRHAKTVVHGKSDLIEHDGRTIFRNVPTPTSVVRYHSLTIDAVPEEFEPSATSISDGEIMAVRHKTLPIEAVQFHPESWLSEFGPQMMANFCSQVASRRA